MHRGLKANYLPMVALKNRDRVDDGDYRGSRITRRILKKQKYFSRPIEVSGGPHQRTTSPFPPASAEAG